jgi:hypothetical protein
MSSMAFKSSGQLHSAVIDESILKVYRDPARETVILYRRPGPAGIYLIKKG